MGMKLQTRILCNTPKETPSMPSDSISTDLMEGHYADAYGQFAHLVGKLNAPDSQQRTHGEVETLIHCEGMELLRHLIQGHLASEKRG